MTDKMNNDCYKITICSPDGKEEVYETNIAFLVCDTGDRIETAHLCYDGVAMDVFQVVKVGRRAILEMIPRGIAKCLRHLPVACQKMKKMSSSHACACTCVCVCVI